MGNHVLFMQVIQYLQLSPQLCLLLQHLPLLQQLLQQLILITYHQHLPQPQEQRLQHQAKPPPH